MSAAADLSEELLSFNMLEVKCEKTKRAARRGSDRKHAEILCVAEVSLHTETSPFLVLWFPSTCLTEHLFVLLTDICGLNMSEKEGKTR